MAEGEGAPRQERVPLLIPRGETGASLVSPFPTNNININTTRHELMEHVVLSLFVALGYLILVIKTLGFRRTLKYQILLDLVFTAGLPALASGWNWTVTAILAGIWLSLALILLTLITRLLKKGSALLERYE